MNLYSA